MQKLHFDDDFLWGCATASYQVEGAIDEDGRVPSIWDTFTAQQGTIMGGDDGRFAADQYHRYKEDVALIAELGFDAYRFSIAWPRIITDRDGTVNEAGLDYYIRLCKELSSHGIKSVATLYHWDLPQYLEDRGGWDNRETAYAFEYYAKVVFEHLGPYVDMWTTLNEPFCSSYLGYRDGIHAPGYKDPKKAYNAVHHLNLAHGLAMRAYRATGLTAPIGTVLNPSMPRPATRRPEDKEAADIARAFDTDVFLKPLFGQGYPDHLLNMFNIILPIQEGDMKIIGTPVDFIGINYYQEYAVVYDKQSPLHYHPVPVWQRTTNQGWPIVPYGLNRILSYFKEVTGNIPLYVTENGCAGDDELTEGRVHDHFRCEYINEHLAACKRAIDEGVNLKGYFAWSLLDNFEWSWGYSRRFGIVYVDYDTQKRYPKDSAYMLRDIITGYCEF
jgi:beta-glucosidase